MRQNMHIKEPKDTYHKAHQTHRKYHNVHNAYGKNCISHWVTGIEMIQLHIKQNLKRWLVPLRARILLLGFIKAESAVIGLLSGCIGMLISMITTLFCGDVSLTQIYLSDSIVTWVKVINCWLIPTLGSWNQFISNLELKDRTLIKELQWI